MGQSLHPDTFSVQDNAVTWNGHTVHFAEQVSLSELAQDYMAYLSDAHGMGDNVLKVQELLGDQATSFAEIYSNDLSIFDTIGETLVNYNFAVGALENIDSLQEELSKYSEDTIESLLESVPLFLIDRHYPGCLSESEPFCVYGSEERVREALVNEVELLFDEGDSRSAAVLAELKEAKGLTAGYSIALPDDTILSVEPTTALELVNLQDIEIRPRESGAAAPGM